MRIFLDTAPLIYLAEGGVVFQEPVKNQLERWLYAGGKLGSSTMTLTELLVGPKRKGYLHIAAQYRSLLLSLLADPLIPLDEAVAEKASDYRARFNLRTPDAVQLAAAVTRQYDVFYTNDERLSCPDIEVVVVER